MKDNSKALKSREASFQNQSETDFYTERYFSFLKGRKSTQILGPHPKHPILGSQKKLYVPHFLEKKRQKGTHINFFGGFWGQKKGPQAGHFRPQKSKKFTLVLLPALDWPRVGTEREERWDEGAFPPLWTHQTGAICQIGVLTLKRCIFWAQKGLFCRPCLCPNGTKQSILAKIHFFHKKPKLRNHYFTVLRWGKSKITMKTTIWILSPPAIFFSIPLV